MSRLSSNSNSTGHRSLQKRFLLVIIVFPLWFCTVLTSITIYSKLHKEILLSYYEYATCLQKQRSANGQTDEYCPPTYRKYRTVTSCILNLLMLNIYSFVQVAYILVPKAARRFWSDIFSKITHLCSRCVGRGKNLSHSRQLLMKNIDESDSE